MNKRNTGNYYEDAAAEYLKDKGIEIVCRNFACRIGEIDIIGRDKDTLVFFEVKYRKNDSYGDALQAVDLKKQKKIIRVADYFIMTHDTGLYYRFDVIGITGDRIDWIKNAFGAG
ncbi:MAG: YraN family protein [Lachnospiraceae bacterium]|nr:YraN family protein [Lachnospiraceae bacterium]